MFKINSLFQRNIIAGLILTLPFSRFLNFDVVANLAISDLFLLANFLIALLNFKISKWSIPIFLLFLTSALSFLSNMQGANIIVLFSFLLKAFLSVQILNTREHYLFYTKTLVLSGVFWILMGLFLTEGMFLDLSQDYSHNKNELGHYCLVTYFFSFFIFFSRDLRVSKDYKLLSLFVMVGSAIMIILSFSRGALISWLLVQLLFLIWNRKIFISALAVAITFLFLPFLELGERQYQRLDTLVNLEASTRADKERINNLILGYELFMTSPLVGVGPGVFISVNPEKKVMHNTYASTTVELGVLGFIALLSILFLPVFLFFKYQYRKEPLFNPVKEYSLYGAIFAVTIHSLTIESLSKFAIFISFSILISAILFQRAK